ncbi:hypothetical protein SISNIDRAFT_486408 [Sistotremastrum niveocremeum HHB9708]|uniref:SH3 domain-containing protein n=1 Tax=Sistotremastrum niveocremeum HHB9708 TaxID=1314777 RepID=A0A164THF8_9AGAM|nr:hypothetical protein SISNIDRAFT_486408 [Sistotremastrum niveocremeum HHB9708]
MNQQTLEHLAAQLVRDVDHLVSEGHISKQDAEIMKAKLSPSAEAPIARTTAGLGSLSIGGQPGSVKARAIWSYNENGSDPNDLTMSEGDIVEILEEVNQDWWRGRVTKTGREGLFPSNYVEKLEGESEAQSPQSPPTVKSSFRKNWDPPPTTGGTNRLGLQQVDNSSSKAKTSKYGNQAGTAAARGVGMGAGAALGGKLVRAIF